MIQRTNAIGFDKLTRRDKEKENSIEIPTVNIYKGITPSVYLLQAFYLTLAFWKGHGLTGHVH